MIMLLRCLSRPSLLPPEISHHSGSDIRLGLASNRPHNCACSSSIIALWSKSQQAKLPGLKPLHRLISRADLLAHQHFHTSALSAVARSLKQCHYCPSMYFLASQAAWTEAYARANPLAYQQDCSSSGKSSVYSLRHHALSSLQALLERIVAPGAVLHCQGEHLCHKGVLRLERQRLVIVVNGILYPILHRREISITSGDRTA